MRQNIVFKEWAPDLPDLGPEALITARNVLPSINGYKPFHPLDQSMGTAASSYLPATFVSAAISKFDNNVYAWDLANFYVGSGSSFTTRGVSTAVSSAGAFAQYGNLVIFAGGAVPKKHTVGSSSNFSTLASASTSDTAPAAMCIGVIGQFVLMGNIWDAVTANSAPNGLQWSGIDAPTSWPTPNSQTAIAEQAGYQSMDLRYGRVTGIHGGDQHGVVLQDTAVTRMTYVGPPVVFQFDNIDNKVGSIYPNRSIKAGPFTYFVSRLGFCRTDGVSVERIGAGKVDDYFSGRNAYSDIQISYDALNKNVMFAYASTTPSLQTLNSLLIFNEDTGMWSECDTGLVSLVTPGGGTDDAVVTRTAMAFSKSGTNSILGKFQATAGSAVIETSDAEFNPGGRSWVDGIKANVESSATAPSIGIRLGYRDDLGTTPSYTSTTTPTSATGFADFRVDAKYIRAEINVTGNFTKLPSMVANVEPAEDR